MCSTALADADIPVMATTRTGPDAQIADLLSTARRSLRLSVAFLSRLDGTTQHLEVVEAAGPASLLFREGATQRQETLVLPGDPRRPPARR